MNHIIYELDEFEPWPGQACYVWGTAIITYDWSPAQPSVGWRGGPTNIRLQSLVISGDKEPLIIPYGTPFFEIVARTIESDDHVAQKCVEDWQNA